MPTDLEKFTVSQENPAGMTITEIVAEYRLIQAGLNRPHVNGWFGFSGSYASRLESRLTQLRKCLADEYLKQHEINILLGEN